MKKKELLGNYFVQDLYDYYNYIKNSGREKDKPKIEVVEEYIRKREEVCQKQKRI